MPYALDGAPEPGPHIIQERDLVPFQVSENNQLLEPPQEVPAVRHPCESVLAERDGDRVLDARLRTGQAVDLPLRHHQRPVLEVAVIHAEQDRLAVLLTPFLRAGVALLVCRVAVLDKPDIVLLIAKRKQQNVLAVLLRGYLVQLRDLLGDAPPFEILDGSRFAQELLRRTLEPAEP